MSIISKITKILTFEFWLQQRFGRWRPGQPLFSGRSRLANAGADPRRLAAALVPGQSAPYVLILPPNEPTGVQRFPLGARLPGL